MKNINKALIEAIQNYEKEKEFHRKRYWAGFVDALRYISED